MWFADTAGRGEQGPRFRSDSTIDFVGVLPLCVRGNRVLAAAGALATLCSSALLAQTTRPPEPSLIVTPTERMMFSGPEGGPFYPTFSQYHVSATTGTIKYTIRVPAWLTVALDSGTTDATGRTVTVLLNKEAAERLRPGNYGPGVAFTNVTNGKGSTVRPTTLTVNVRPTNR
jgi:hypothetical protein